MHCRIFGSLRHGDNTPAYRWTPHPLSLQVKSFLNIVVLSFLKSVTGNTGDNFQKSTGVRSQWLPSSFIRKGVGYDIYYKTGLAPVLINREFCYFYFSGSLKKIYYSKQYSQAHPLSFHCYSRNSFLSFYIFSFCLTL